MTAAGLALLTLSLDTEQHSIPHGPAQQDFRRWADKLIAQEILGATINHTTINL